MSNNIESHPAVGHICSGQLITIDVSESLLEAARLMDYKRVGALGVLDKGSLVGIISEADLVSAIVDQVPMQATPVQDYMTEAPITVSATDDPALAARYMLEHEIGHLPVMESCEAVGMLSRSDLLAVGAVPSRYRNGRNART